MAALGLKIGAEHADVDVRFRGLVTAAHVSVRSAQFGDHFTYQVIEIASMRYRSEEHTSELQSQSNLVCRLLLEKKKNTITNPTLSSTLRISLPCVPHVRRV